MALTLYLMGGYERGGRTGVGTGWGKGGGGGEDEEEKKKKEEEQEERLGRDEVPPS